MRWLSILLVLSSFSGVACHKAKTKEIKSVATKKAEPPATSGTGLSSGDSTGEISQIPSLPPAETKPIPVGTGEFGPIYFQFDDSSLTMESMRKLDEIGEYLDKHPMNGVVISGHTDERGTEEYNLALSDLRAIAAKDYLTRLRIDPERISLVPYGEELPVVAGSDEESWSKNRRDEFKIVQKTALRD